MSTFDDPRSVPVRTNLLGAGKPKPASDAVVQLIAPAAERVAEGEHVKLTTLDSLKALVGLPVAGAVCIPDARLMGLALANADLIGVSFVKLTDYPNAEYSPEFERMTWDLPTVSYNELLADVASERRRKVSVEAQAGARPKPAKREQTLDRDRKNHFSEFTRAKGLNGGRSGDGEGDDDGNVDPAA